MALRKPFVLRALLELVLIPANAVRPWERTAIG